MKQNKRGGVGRKEKGERREKREGKRDA